MQNAFKPLFSDARGNISIMMGLAIIVLVGMVGASIDLGRAHALKSKLSNAVDAAGLAGGAVVNSGDIGAVINEYFTANFPADYMDATVTGPDWVLSADQKVLTVTASATVKSAFMQLMGHNSITVRAETEITRETRGMELVLVMDNTGSMRSGAKMDTMITAAKDLVDILYGGEETVPNLWVGLVPYAASVNIGPQHADWLVNPITWTDHQGTFTRSLVAAPGDDADSDTMNILDPADPDSMYFPTAWKGCVEARAHPEDTTDNLPEHVGGWQPLFWPDADVDNDWFTPAIPPEDEDDEGTPESYAINEANSAQNNGTGPNLGCGPPILPLTAERSAIKTAIDGMQPWHRGGTVASVGLAWGWRVISPQWRGKWDGAEPNTLPLNYHHPLMNKVAIILTDGVNQMYDWHNDDELLGSDYTAYGRVEEGILGGATTLTSAKNEINSRLASICNAMKAQGVIIYTIVFQENDADTQNLYRNCASDPAYFFVAPTNADLLQVFRAIGDALGNLRISK